METWLIAATCAHCRKSIRLGQWALGVRRAAPNPNIGKGGIQRYNQPRRTSHFSISTATNTVVANMRQIPSSTAVSGCV